MLTRLQSLGWEHYEVHEPEPHILLFKYDPLPLDGNNNNNNKDIVGANDMQATDQLPASDALRRM
jgi:hypothetical protein